MSLTQLLELRKYADDVAAIAAYIIAIASIIVKLTPNLKDDTFLLSVIKFVSKYIALNRTTKDDIIRSKS